MLSSALTPLIVASTWSVQPFAAEVSLHRYEAVEVALPLRRSPKPDVSVIRRIEQASPGVRVLPWYGLEGNSIRYAVQAERPGVSIVIQSFELVRRGRVLKRFRLRQRFRVADTSPDPSFLDTALDVIRAHTETESSDAALTRGQAQIEVARRWLRGFVHQVDDPRVPAIVRVLAPDAPPPGVSVRPTDVVPVAPSELEKSRSENPMSGSPRALLNEARRALDALDLDAAAEALRLVRRDPRATLGELARALEWGAALALLRGRDNLARQLVQQATTLFPELTPRNPFPWAQQRFIQLRQKLAPAQRLAIGRVTVEPSQDGSTVSVEFGPDAGRLVRRARVERVQTQTTRTSPVLHEGLRGRSRIAFPSTEATGSQALRVMLLDEVGRVLAEEGTTAPLYVPVVETEASSSPRVPSWVWWTLGGVALAGAAAATVILATDGGTPEPDRGIGPFDIEF
ncbi:MAG: hypothetical protein ACFB9M_09335 [Myxococcota bacterium]